MPIRPVNSPLTGGREADTITWTGCPDSRQRTVAASGFGDPTVRAPRSSRSPAPARVPYRAAPASRCRCPRTRSRQAPAAHELRQASHRNPETAASSTSASHVSSAMSACHRATKPYAASARAVMLRMSPRSISPAHLPVPGAHAVAPAFRMSTVRPSASPVPWPPPPAGGGAWQGRRRPARWLRRSRFPR